MCGVVWWGGGGGITCPVPSKPILQNGVLAAASGSIFILLLRLPASDVIPAYRLLVVARGTGDTKCTSGCCDSHCTVALRS